MVGAAAGGISVIVPVWNEAAVLPRTVPAVLAALAGVEARLVYVCNGCTDDSAAVLRRLLAGYGSMIELPEAGKTQALNAGDAAAEGVFPRFYLDADVCPAPGAFALLWDVLKDGDADLVAPEIRFDMSQATRAARWAAEVWLALPHGQGAAFHHMLGVSQAGRALWGAFPAVQNDDVFIEASVPVGRRSVVSATYAVTRPPASLPGWIATRRRWARGERELAAMGTAVPRAAGQRRALLGLLLHPAWTVKVLVYLAVRALSRTDDGVRWSRDR